MRNEYDEMRFKLYKELFENLPPELSEELSRQMLDVRRRQRTNVGESLITEPFLENIIRSNIVNREVDRRLPRPAELDWLTHNRVADILVKKGAKILNIGNKGYPDLLFEIHGEVFAAEIKGKGDYVRAHQQQVIQALRRLKRIYVVRESGAKKHPNELTLEEFLSDVVG